MKTNVEENEKKLFFRYLIPSLLSMLAVFLRMLWRTGPLQNKDFTLSAEVPAQLAALEL